MTPIPQQLKNKWAAMLEVEVIDKQEMIDPQHRHLGWTPLIMGWAIGKGFTIEEARMFAIWAVLEYDLAVSK